MFRICETFGVWSASFSNAQAKIDINTSFIKNARKFWVKDERDSCEVIAWNLKPEDEPKGVFDLAVVPQVNDFNGHLSVQLKLIDWRPTTER